MVASPHMERLTMDLARSIRLVIAACLATSAVGLWGLATPTAAAAPPPPLDACLAGGSFSQGAPECSVHRPAWGTDFGVIGSVVQHVVDPGDVVALGFQPSTTIDFTEPESCGDAGCIWNSVSWRPEAGAPLEIVSGCGARDLSCSVRVGEMPEVGDGAERWMVMYAEHFRGRFAQEGVAHAISVTPRFYPVTVEAVGPDGAPRGVDLGETAYAVRAGATAAAGTCADVDWIWPLKGEGSFSVPDCVALRRDDGSGSGRQGFQGYLPVDSGSWTIVAGPGGDPGTALIGRPSLYRPIDVTPTGDDIVAAIIQERRPAARVQVVPQSSSMQVGSVQDVRITVSAEEGDAGSIELTFADPTLLDVSPTDGQSPLLEVVEVLEGMPADPIPLAPGDARAFTVRVRALTPGSMFLGADVTGWDDLGNPANGSDGRQLTIGLPGGDGSVEPPVIGAAVARPDGGGVAGNVAGAPGSTLGVTIWTAPATADGGCARQVVGTEVDRLGSTDVTIGEDGTATFTLGGALVEGRQVYGVAAAGTAASDVSRCVTVTAGLPAVSIGDATIEEGTGDGQTTELTLDVELSGTTDRPVAVTIRTADGSAVAPADYRAADDTITIPPGATNARVVIAIVADDDPEPEETFEVAFSDAVEATIASDAATAIVTILDDDADAAPALDVRGTWRAPKGDPTTLVIDTQDRATGKVTGTFNVPRVGAITMSGTLDGRRLTLKGRNQEITGTMTGLVARKKGVLTVTFTIKDSAGRGGKLTMRLTDPAG
jgi:hypothetical protein